MKILHVLPSLDERYGGPLGVVLDLSARSLRYDVQSEILGFGDIHVGDNSFPRGLLHALPLGYPRAYCYSPQLRPWLRSNLGRFDGVVIHGMWLYPNWVTAEECLGKDIPYSYFPHGMLERWPVYGQSRVKTLKKAAYWFLRERAILARSAAVLFTTQREAAAAASTFKLPSVRAIVIPYGISISDEKVEAPCNPELTIPNDRKIALFLGRIHPKKNPGFLLEAWAEAAPKPEWLLIIAGPGDPLYVDSLKKLALQLGIGRQVRFLDMVTGRNKSYLFQRASWFLLPSQQENFGNAVLEAIRHDCPPVVSDQVYISEFFHNDAEVLPLNRKCWVEFLCHRMMDESRRLDIIKANQLYIKPQFDINHIASGWATTFTQLFCGRLGYEAENRGE